MKALRTSSVAGLETTLQANQISIMSHTNAISILNGDASTEGSLAKTLADMNAYTDTLEGTMDTTQMDANTAAIALLNDTTPGKVGSVQTQFQAVQNQAATYADTTIVDGTSGQIGALDTDIETVTGYVGDYIPTDRNGLLYSNYYSKEDTMRVEGTHIWIADIATTTGDIVDNDSAGTKTNNTPADTVVNVGDKICYTYSTDDKTGDIFEIVYVQRKDGSKEGIVYVPTDCNKDPFTNTPNEDVNLNSNDILYVRTEAITVDTFLDTYSGSGASNDHFYGDGISGSDTIEAGWIISANAEDGQAEDVDNGIDGENNRVYFNAYSKPGTVYSDGTLKTKFNDLVNNADVMFDTLDELQAADADYQQEIADLTDVVAANKTSIENALQAHKDNYAADKTALDDTFTAERTTTDTDISNAVSDYGSVTALKTFWSYDQEEGAFSGTGAGAASSCRVNIDAADAGILGFIYSMGYHLFYILENKTVDAGKIVLNTDVTIPRLKHIRIEYPGYEYDTLVHTVGENPGEFIVQESESGDLDGVDVSVRYVTATNPDAGDQF